MIAITYGTAPERLSEQEYVNCECGGCDGGWYTTAWEYSQRANGHLVYEDYPYKGEGTGSECNVIPAGRRVRPPSNVAFTNP